MTEGTSGQPRPEEPVTAASSGTSRPLAVNGLVGAAWCVGIGLTVLMTITLVGWIAAPRTALGPGLPGVFRTAVNLWLVAHHAGFSVEADRVGLLPLGLMVLPGALLHRSGGWIVRVSDLSGQQRTGVMHVAFALAAPYAALAGSLALAARSEVVTPSAWQALFVCFALAMVAGGLGAARAMVASRSRHVRSGLGALLRLLPDRPRSLVMGVVGSVSVLMASGALLVGVSLVVHLADAKAMYAMLAPGLIGGVLLFLLELVFLPNAVIWGMCYTIGPGFAVGEGTSVSPTGVFINIIPSFPPLAALPEAGPAPALSLFALAAPFVAGAVGGVLTIRAMPSPVYEAAPLWGFLSGVLTGLVSAVLAALSGGPLGGGRLATMGPSAWQIGLMATLEVGVSAAVAAWAANWVMLRRPESARAARRAARKEARRARKAPTRRNPVGTPAGGTPSGGAPSGDTATAGTGAGAGRTPAASRTAAKPVVPPYMSEPVEFVEPEPVLAVRKPPRRSTAPLPSLDEDAAEGRDRSGRQSDHGHAEPARPPRPRRPAEDGGSGRSEASARPAESPVAPASGLERERRADAQAQADAVAEAEAMAETGAGAETGAEAGADTDPPRVERRSGALYVLRDDPPPERRARPGDAQ